MDRRRGGCPPRAGCRSRTILFHCPQDLESMWAETRAEVEVPAICIDFRGTSTSKKHLVGPDVRHAVCGGAGLPGAAIQPWHRGRRRVGAPRSPRSSTIRKASEHPSARSPSSGVCGAQLSTFARTPPRSGWAAAPSNLAPCDSRSWPIVLVVVGRVVGFRSRNRPSSKPWWPRTETRSVRSASWREHFEAACSSIRTHGAVQRGV